jgi:hypothetical protein
MKKKNLGHPSYLIVSCTGYHILADVWDQIKHNKRPLLPVYKKSVICRLSWNDLRGLLESVLLPV